jgi:hypothetical protein
MTGPADASSDPVFVLEGRLRDRSGGSMIVALRDVWHMACRRNFTGSYEDAHHLLAATGRYRLAGDLDAPLMIRPISEARSLAKNCTHSDAG